MSIRVVYLHPDPAQPALLRGTTHGELRPVLESARRGGASAFCVVSSSDATVFAGVENLVLPVHRPRAKQQTASCIRRGKVALISSPFTSAGRLLQSLRAFQSEVVEQRGALVVFFVATEAIFADLWCTALEPEPATRRLFPLIRGGDGFPPAAAWDPDPIEWKVVIDNGIVPDSLRLAYIGESAAAKLVRFRILHAAHCDLPVLILGENGTGKEIVAQRVHAESRRSGEHLVAVNCVAIPELLFESVMFGHRKGSFSGALDDHTGHWARADKGTLFLDEIGDLSLTAQGKLLRALDSGEITPVGGVPIHPNVRIITATNQDLEAMVEAGTFRQDLFHRLFGYVIRTPSLRSRREDIAGLARSFWRKFEANGALPLSDEVIAYLQTLQWPGNVRELKMRLEVLFEDFGSATITVAHLDALFHSEGEMVGFGTRVGVRTFADHLDQCLQHVLRAIDVVRKSQVPMRYPMEGKSLDDMTLARIVIQTRHRVAELEELCHHPGHFHYTKTWEATRECKRALREFADLLASSPDAALALWKRETEAATERATRLLFAALHKLERLARGGTDTQKAGR